MRQLRLLFLTACALPEVATAQTFSAARIHADVAYLADDLLEGRATGTRGYDLAARYVAARYQALGLQPGTATGWYQTIDFVTADRDSSRPSTIGFGGKTWTHGDHVFVNHTVLGDDVSGEAEMVFVGYGLEDPKYGLDDYKDLDVRGKVVVQLRGTPDGLPSDVAATMSNKKLDLAEAKGAVGVISVAPPSFFKLYSWEKLLDNANLSRMAWKDPQGKVQINNPALRLSANLDPTAAQALFAGTSLAGERLLTLLNDKTARPKGFVIPGKVRIERRGKLGAVQSANVVGLLPGSDPKLKDEVILLSAHLDHVGFLAPKNGDSIANGALDNAAGVATMMEVARAFTDSGKRPKRSVMFVALTGEEKGLFGSEYIAKHPALAGKKVVGNVNLDMPLLKYNFTDVVAFGAEHSTIGQAAARAARTAGVTLTPDPYPEENLFVRSDHYSFVKEGVPAISLDLGPANGGKAASEKFRDTDYHGVGDDMNQTFNWDAGARFAQINYLIARDLADAPQAPRWYENNFFGDRFAPDAPKAKKP